jgi:ribose 5-phosphate isomerase A
MNQDDEKRYVGEAAAEEVEDGMILGLGTGSTMKFFAQALALRIRNGLSLQAIPTSRQSRGLAEANGIPQIGWDGIEAIDLCVDGADEITPDLAMIKGGGGALLWEKIVASASQRRLYIADSSKLVKELGAFPLPVEVVKFGHTHVGRILNSMSGDARLRLLGEKPFTTDSGNLIYDCRFGSIPDPADLDRRLTAIPGIVETGLFVGMANQVLTVLDGKIVSRFPATGGRWR